SKGEQTKQLIKEALSQGYKHFDCAPLYQNQSDIGLALEETIAKGIISRDELFITSKLPMNAMKSIRHVDENIFYPTDGDTGLLLADSEVDFCETWKEMERLCKMGLIKSIGVSNFNQEQIDRILKICTIKPAVLQIELHAYLQQRPFRQYCNQHEITIEAFAPIGSPLEAIKQNKDVLLEDKIIKEIAKRYNRSTAQILLRWLIENKIVAVPSSCNREQLRKNISVFDFTLSREDIQLIDSLDRNCRIFYFDKIQGVKEHREYPFKEQ
ncbi:1:5-anhydro-D-fructose reductase-like protein, partial [Dinothrombium tinctorium]